MPNQRVGGNAKGGAPKADGGRAREAPPGGAAEAEAGVHREEEGERSADDSEEQAGAAHEGGQQGAEGFGK